jgi:hypothetical protein
MSKNNLFFYEKYFYKPILINVHLNLKTKIILQSEGISFVAHTGQSGLLIVVDGSKIF